MNFDEYSDEELLEAGRESVKREQWPRATSLLGAYAARFAARGEAVPASGLATYALCLGHANELRRGLDLCKRALNADPRVQRFLAGGPQPWDRARSWRHLAFLIGHWQLCGIGMWALERKEGGAFAGVIGFAEPEGWPGCELAWKLAPLWWGQGFATEGARAALDYAFTVLGKERLVSLIRPDNRASIRVAERLGETFQGRHDLAGQDYLVYGISRTGGAGATPRPTPRDGELRRIA